MYFINFSEYFSDLLGYSDEENDMMSTLSNRSSLSFAYDDFLTSFSNEENYDESYEDKDKDVISAIPDTTMAVFFAKKVTSSSDIEETKTGSNIVETGQLTFESTEDSEADAKNKCVCGKGPIPNITMTRLEAEKTRHNLIITAQRYRSKRETFSKKQGQDYDDYIVNGYKDTQEPWLAVLFHGTNPFCGGTIINQRFILTGW